MRVYILQKCATSATHITPKTLKFLSRSCVVALSSLDTNDDDDAHPHKNHHLFFFAFFIVIVDF